MSRDPGDPGAPRRPRPKANRPAGSSTFRPNPNAGTGRSRPVRDGASDPEDDRRASNPAQAVLFGRVNSGTLALFCRQFASYLDAGVDLMKALTSLEKQYARTAMGPVVGRISLAVRRGDSMTEAVRREPKAFDSLFVSMIQVAEMRGGIPETLRMLSRHYEARQRLIRQARSAMIYPLAVLLVASGVVALLTLWLLPKFIDMLTEFPGQGATLPLPSRALMAFSRFVQTLGWWLIPLVMIGGPFLLLSIYRTGAGKRLLDNLIIRVPVFGLLLRKLDITRFSRTLGTLLGSGVDVGASIDLTADVMRLDPLRRAVADARSFIMDGGELSEALLESRWFGPDVIAVVESGEETGKLPESLERLADDYEEQVAYMVRNMGQLVQPMIMIFMGGLVLFIILAVLLPYIALLTNLSGAH
jgi:type II secretory pathway component PulF